PMVNNRLMERLPTETVKSILLLLDPESRVTYALTCKSWYSIASRSHALYETICCHDFNTWMRRCRYFTANRQCGNSVKTLEYKVANSPLSSSNIAELPTIFPNIRHFRLFFEEHIQNVKRDRAYSAQRTMFGDSLNKVHACYQGAPGEAFDGWHNLTSMEETSTKMYTAFILNCSTTPFRHLTSLWLDFSHIDAVRCLDPAMDYLFKGLKNTPQLEELTLIRSRISFDKLNVLHNRCPVLQTITLMNVNLSANSSRKPATKKAAIHLKTFKLHSCYFSSAETIILYVGGKYPNLENLVLDCSDRPGFEPALKSVVRSYIAKATHLKNFGTNLFQLHPQFINFMETNGITELDELYIGNHNDPDILPIAEKDPHNSLITVCDNANFKVSLKTLKVAAVKLPNGFNNRYLDLTNLTTLEVNFQANEGCEEDDRFGDYFRQDPIPEPVLSLTDLFRTLVHLKKLVLNHIGTTMDEELADLHCIEEINISGSHQLYTDEFGVAYSLFDFISNNCLQIRLITLFNFTLSNAPDDYQPVLNLSVHKHITRVNTIYKFYMHIHPRGWPVTCYSNKHSHYKKVQKEEITSKYLILQSEHRKMFWTPMAPQKPRRTHYMDFLDFDEYHDLF
ncbi:hypothetical protein MBANPS3_008910, partial [Mucor bainieri]